MNGSWLEVNVDASAMRCLVAEPTAPTNAPGGAPAVVLCMHAPGIDDFMIDIADRLNAHGYATVLPDLYHRQLDNNETPLQRMAQLRDDEVFRDLAAATAALRMRVGVNARRCAVVGFCMGGRLALLQVARDATLDAAVVFYGGFINESWGEGATPLQWSARITAPVLGLYGADDTNPSPADVAQLTAVLSAQSVRHELHSFPGCGHAFLNFQRPSYREDAAADAWARCVAWLDAHVAFSHVD